MGVFSCISEVSILRRILLNVIINDEDDRLKSTVSRFKDDTTWGVDTEVVKVMTSQQVRKMS